MAAHAAALVSFFLLAPIAAGLQRQHLRQPTSFAGLELVRARTPAGGGAYRGTIRATTGHW